jgi:hypothetical protein
VCGIVIDGIILIAVLSVVTGEDLGSDLGGLLKAGLLALGASLVGALVAGGLSVVVPYLVAQLAGLTVAATGLGLLIMLVYSIETKRALLGVAGYVGVKLAFTLAIFFFAS